MYGAMKAIYDSGIPIDFKGSMVLKVCLIEAGYHEEIRHTVDIDANWYSESPPTAEQMTDSLQNALRRAGIDLDVSLYRTSSKTVILPPFEAILSNRSACICLSSSRSDGPLGLSFTIGS